MASTPGAMAAAAAQQAQLDYMQRTQEYMQHFHMAQAMQARQPFPPFGFGFQGFPGMMGKGFDPFGYGGFEGFGKGKGKKGKGKGKGKGKSKGKGKPSEASEGAEDGEKKEGDEAKEEGEEGGEKKEAKEKEAPRGSPIVNAQKEARLRFEKDVLDRIQGRWIDEAEPTTTYTVEGHVCSVTGADGGRGFRNRLSVYGVELCWDARRFWHNLNLQDMYAQGDDIQKLEWNPAKDSPPALRIVWLKAPPLPEGEEEKKEGDEAKAAEEAKPAEEAAPAEAPSS